MSATHGLASTYRSQQYACRCADCCRANTERSRVERDARRARCPETDPNLDHGNASTYSNHFCRCRPCRAAQSVKNRKYSSSHRRTA